jgi:hypothetical protein
MAIKNLAKADALIRKLAEDLKLRTAGAGAGRVNTVREARDAQSAPLLVLSRDGNEAAGQPVIQIRIKQIDAVSKDVFGNDLLAFAPHLAEIAYQTAEPSALDLMVATFELSKLGVRTQIKELAGAVTPANADAAAASEDLDWIHWPTKGV